MVSVTERSSISPAVLAWILLKLTASTPAAVPPRLLIKIPPEVLLVALMVEAITSIWAFVPVAPMPVVPVKLTVAPRILLAASLSASEILPPDDSVTVLAVPASTKSTAMLPVLLIKISPPPLVMVSAFNTPDRVISRSAIPAPPMLSATSVILLAMIFAMVSSPVSASVMEPLVAETGTVRNTLPVVVMLPTARLLSFCVTVTVPAPPVAMLYTVEAVPRLVTVTLLPPLPVILNVPISSIVRPSPPWLAPPISPVALRVKAVAFRNP